MDTRHRMDPEALARAVDADRVAGLNPWMVVASAGTTDVGAVDPLSEVGALARAEGPLVPRGRGLRRVLRPL